MSDKSFVELKALVQYANELNELSKTLKDSLNKTKSGLEELMTTFKDEQSKAFKSKFDEDYVKLKPIAETLDRYIDQIKGPLKTDIEEYNKIRWKNKR